MIDGMALLWTLTVVLVPGIPLIRYLRSSAYGLRSQ
jgi:hypothetical protein